jgi:CheY-like chemotaxis protein
MRQAGYATEYIEEMARAPIRVLIADDSVPVVEMLSELLAAPGSVEVVATADSEPAAVASVRELKPDVLVLDLQLKGGSGANVIKAIRADPGLGGVRIAVTSNHTSPQLKAACLGLGAERYFDKVKELRELAAFVRGL